MSNVQPLKPKGESPVTSGKPPEIADFPTVLGELAQQVAVQATKLGRQQFDMKLDALKTLTAYQSMLNRAADGDEGAGILDIRNRLVEPTPEMKPEEPEQEENDNGGAEDP